MDIPTNKVPVTKRALVQRINRNISQSVGRLHLSRGTKVQQVFLATSTLLPLTTTFRIYISETLKILKHSGEM